MSGLNTCYSTWGNGIGATWTETLYRGCVEGVKSIYDDCLQDVPVPTPRPSRADCLLRFLDSVKNCYGYMDPCFSQPNDPTGNPVPCKVEPSKNFAREECMRGAKARLAKCLEHLNLPVVKVNALPVLNSVVVLSEHINLAIEFEADPGQSWSSFQIKYHVNDPVAPGTWSEIEGPEVFNLGFPNGQPISFTFDVPNAIYEAGAQDVIALIEVNAWNGEKVGVGAVSMTIVSGEIDLDGNLRIDERDFALAVDRYFSGTLSQRQYDRTMAAVVRAGHARSGGMSVPQMTPVP